MTKLNNDFYIEALIPITLLLAMQYIELYEKQGNESKLDSFDILKPIGENFK